MDLLNELFVRGDQAIQSARRDRTRARAGSVPFSATFSFEKKTRAAWNGGCLTF